MKKQSELIDTAIGQKVQGIVLDNADSTASVAAIKKAKDAGIPVVLINREIPVDDLALVQITHNNVQAGSEVANVFVEKMTEKGKYAELTCNLADNNCVTRSKSFHQVLDQYPDMVSIARQDAKDTLIDGKRIMDSILQAHPDVKGVICGNGPIAPGAIAALKAAGRNDVVVVGIDGSNDERDAVKAGTLKATVMLQAQSIAAQSVTVLDNFLKKGEKPAQQRVMFRGILITQDIANANPALEMEADQWQRVIDINLTGVWNACKAEAELMAEYGGGSIINIASISGIIVNRGLQQAHYNCSKAGVIHLSKSLAMEWVDKHIRVNSMSPGYTATPMNTRPEMLHQTKAFENQTPMQRMAKVEEMAGPALFLASDAASFCTGIDRVVDGGFVCW